MAERIRITGKNDGVNDNEAIDAQVDSTYDAVHVKSHLFGYDGVAGFTNPVSANSAGAMSTVIGLEIPKHDYVALSYTGDNLTGVVYYVDGVGGTIVATLALSYTGSVLNSI